MDFWRTISNIGVQYGANPKERRYIVLCNRVSLAIFLLVILLFIISWGYFRWIAATQLALSASLLFLIPLLLNHFGFLNFSRLFLIGIITIMPLVVSIADKNDHSNSIEEFEFYQYRILLLGSSIVPFILFSLKERASLLIGLLMPLLAIILFDPIHNSLGFGYYQLGFTSPNYYFLNYITLYGYLVLIGSTIFLKYSFEKAEEINETLITELSERQKEILSASQIIEQQREELKVENMSLNQEVVDKNHQLIETNKELIRQNNELQQFSYTISHNLRGPVASLTGLLNLINHAALDDENKEILMRLTDSVNTLDGTIKDLSNIIDIRNDISRVKQKISLEHELNEIKTLLKKEIEDHNVTIQAFFDDDPLIYSVKPMLHSVLYNLVSNAIKYRSMERKPVITIKSLNKADATQISIEDNGIGIDLENFGPKLFGLYKRFHLHTEGRGLGLYLVKLQVEALEGKIEVESVLDEGTKFTLTFPKASNIDEQILLDNKIATLYFNAPLNCIAINWKKTGSIEETKELLKKSIDFIKDYRTINWISNLTRVVEREEGELNDWRKNHRNELRKAGLKRVGLVLPETMVKDFTQKKGFEDVYDVEIKTFSTTNAAKRWIESENEKSP